MKYCVENDLSLFEFHDSVFSIVGFDGKDMVISVKHLNIHKHTEQNPSEYDMEIECAQITFQGFHSPTYEPGRVWKKGSDEKSYPVGPRIVFSGQEAIDRILEELQDKLSVYHFEKEDNGICSIGGCGIEPYFTIEFGFDRVVVSWEAYKKKAWYELHRQYRCDAVLHTPGGDEAVQLTVVCNEEPAYVKGVFKQPPTVSVGCTYDGKAYWGYGSGYSWFDAFTDFQNQLPEEISLKCCLTCRYGNLCPAENNINEVFCAKDAAASRACYRVCAAYLPQSGESLHT